MQVLTLTVSRKQYTEITVTVPDGFDINRLYHAANGKHVGKACDALDADFEDEYGEPVDVEGVKLHPGKEGDLELGQHRSVSLEDVAPELIALDQAEKAKRAEMAFEKMKKASEEGGA